MNLVTLADFAHARAGDKGNILSIAVFPHDAAHYTWLLQALTCDRVAEQFATRQPSKVHRYELPNLKALNFVLEDALEGGVNRSCGLDRHGKSLSYLLLGMRLPGPAD
jgi:hypothetical protein